MLRRALARFWREIVRSLIVGLVALLCTAPAVVATIAGAPFWLVGLAALPLALALTGAASFAATVARADRVTLRALGRVDPVLAIAGTLLSASAGAAFQGAGQLPLLGAALSALLLLVSPVALAYGAQSSAAHERRGLAALRGGLILVAYRPGRALSLLALACIGGFAVAASAGVLMLVAPVAVLVIACVLVGAELDDIEAAQGSPGAQPLSAAQPSSRAQPGRAA